MITTTAVPLSSDEIDGLLEDLVARWHVVEPAHAADGLRGRICDLHRFNFLLWHEEDIARSPDVTDAKIAQVKRAIDGYNQARNDSIEKVDDWLIEELAGRGIVAGPDAPAATETPGAAIDRLSILELQRTHLMGALSRLLGEIFAGQRPLRVFRQMKMYNDPTMNPYLYKTGSRTAA
jgi:hypothetical protein